jgi:cell wall-associated NlpC family hydrolase
MIAGYSRRMSVKTTLCGALLCAVAHASLAAEPPEHIPSAAVTLEQTQELIQNQSLFQRATRGAGGLIDSGLQYLGIRYRFGGSSAETGFDCSGLVRHVFMEALGLNLPRTAREMANVGERVQPSELKPGDLVFFNTMRKTFSHVGIYVGNDQFLHSPSAGGKVRVESMSQDYWRTRFNGARRMVEQRESATSDVQVR